MPMCILCMDSANNIAPFQSGFASHVSSIRQLGKHDVGANSNTPRCRRLFFVFPGRPRFPFRSVRTLHSAPRPSAVCRGRNVEPPRQPPSSICCNSGWVVRNLHGGFFGPRVLFEVHRFLMCLYAFCLWASLDNTGTFGNPLIKQRGLVNVARNYLLFSHQRKSDMRTI
jgi:hypothetical protein